MSVFKQKKWTQLWYLACTRTAHEVNRVYCESLGDMTQCPWVEISEEQQAEAVKVLRAHIHNVYLPPQESHELWVKQMVSLGWKHGKEHNSTNKTHPLLLPYESLSELDKTKQALFKVSVVASMCSVNVGFFEGLQESKED